MTIKRQMDDTNELCGVLIIISALNTVPDVHKVSIKFSREGPEVWLVQLEIRLQLSGFTVDNT